MCGIVGYIGRRKTAPIVLEGLRRLEYRGYDSAGIAVVGADGGLTIRRASGKLHNLEEAVQLSPVDGHFGIGHTRWATHGRPTEENAHPHTGPEKNVVLVHNGIVENYLELRRELEHRGHVFITETDTEVVAHLVEVYLSEGQSFEDAVRTTVKRINGVFALAIMCCAEPGKIIAARNGPPVVIGLGENEYFVASDVPAILSHTRDMFFLDDGDIAVVTEAGVRLMDFDGTPIKRQVTHILWDPILAEKGGYKHFMLKEIHEQPETAALWVARHLPPATSSSLPSAEGLSLVALPFDDAFYEGVERIQILACGTSRHAAQVGGYLLEQLAGLPTTVHYASEFRYAPPPLVPHMLTIGVTQSGETADTLAALAMEQERRRLVADPAYAPRMLGVTNRPESSLGRLVPHILDIGAGIEVGVAATKTFLGQLLAFYGLALAFAERRRPLPGGPDPARLRALAEQLRQLPALLQVLVEDHDRRCAELAHLFADTQDVIFLGRGINYPIAMEGALKLKEISYIHAEGYPAGEMKHGPIALLDARVPVVSIAVPGTVFDKVLSNAQEAKARDAQLLGVAPACGDTEDLFDLLLPLPEVDELLSPLLTVIPMQLLSYHIAAHRGLDVDQPRNLAKSVTVE